MNRKKKEDITNTFNNEDKLFLKIVRFDEKVHGKQNGDVQLVGQDYAGFSVPRKEV